MTGFFNSLLARRDSSAALGMTRGARVPTQACLTKCVRKIGVYGGTFDPVHHAHLILARDALEQLELGEIVFVPAATSPHKLDRRATAPEIRLEMLYAALAGEPRFRVDDRELRRPPPSFTIDTIEEMITSVPKIKIFYLLGSDNLARLPSWHRFDELQRLVEFVILNRGNTVLETAFSTINRPLAISGTEIRNRVATQRSIRYLVPSTVSEIITRRQLYQDSAPSIPTP